MVVLLNISYLKLLFLFFISSYLKLHFPLKPEFIICYLRKKGQQKGKETTGIFFRKISWQKKKQNEKKQNLGEGGG